MAIRSAGGSGRTAPAVSPPAGACGTGGWRSPQCRPRGTGGRTSLPNPAEPEMAHGCSAQRDQLIAVGGEDPVPFLPVPSCSPGRKWDAAAMTYSGDGRRPDHARLVVRVTGEVHRSDPTRLDTPAWVWWAQASRGARPASSSGTG